MNPNAAYLNIIHCDISTATIQSKFIVSNSLFEQNIAQGAGRILELAFSSTGEAIISNSVFVNNEMSRVLQFSDFKNNTIINTVFLGNKQKWTARHGAVTKTQYKSCLFVNEQEDGPLFFDLSPADSLIFENCTLYNSKFDSKLFLSEDYEVFLRNTYIKSVPTNYLYNSSGKTYLANCYLPGFDCAAQYPSVICEGGIITSGDPMFVDTLLGDFRLQPCSPLVNAGSNSFVTSGTDLDEQIRIQGGMVDIGAYESPGFTLASVPTIKPACVGTSNGSISVEPVFGCEPYTYNWLPAAGNGPELNGLPPGNYLLTITDGSGRQILDTLQVGSAPSPVLNPVATNVQCGTTLGGSISAGVSSGTAPFHYQWLPGAADTAYLNHLSPGDYNLTVMDANGCQDSVSASIALMGMITLMVDGQTISCFGETDGWLSATPATGASPFSWLWQGWPGVDSIAQPLGPGFYAVTVSDAFGCTASFAFPPMTEPGLLTSTVGVSDQTDPNMPNGAAVVTTISGGTSPFNYLWNTGSTLPAIAGLTAGTYSVTITDAHGCETVHEVTVQLMVGTGAPELAQVRVWPNPMADLLQVEALDLPGGEGWFVLRDALGREVLEARLKQGRSVLDVGALPKGVYNWVLNLEGLSTETRDVVTGRLVKN